MNELSYESWEHLLREYRTALDQLREWGIRVPDGCRLREYEEALDGFAQRPPVSPEDWASAGYVSMIIFREADEIIEIVDRFPNEPGESAELRLNKPLFFPGISSPRNERER